MKKIFLIFITLFFLCINQSYGAIKVSPSYVELDGNSTKKDYITGSFTVTGGKDEIVRFKVYPVFFKYDTKGRFQELEDKGQINSLMGKIKFYPTEFTCSNGEGQKVRFTITNLKTLPSGESKVMLFLEDTNTREIVLKRANGSIGGSIAVKTRVGVPVFLDKGNYTKHANFDNLTVKNNNGEISCPYKISSTGNSKVRYYGIGYLTQDNKLVKQFQVNGNVVYGGSYLEQIQPIILDKETVLDDNSEYKVKFILTYKDEHNKEKILKKEIKFKPDELSNKTSETR